MQEKAANNRIQLTVKSVTFFAKQKSAPLFTSADAGVSDLQISIIIILTNIFKRAMCKILLLIVISLLLPTGCANPSTGYQSPEFQMSNIKYLYIAHQPKDQRNINLLIKRELETLGYKVDTGSINDMPNTIDALVTYIDKMDVGWNYIYD